MEAYHSVKRGPVTKQAPAALRPFPAVPSETFQRGKRRLAFRLLFAFARPAAQFNAPMIYGAFKNAVVVRTGDRLKLILRRLRRVGLQHFLQLTLGIVEVWNHFQFTKLLAKLTKHKISRGVKTGVEKNRAQQRFERISQRRGTLASAAAFLAAAEDQVFTQAQPAPSAGQHAAVDHLSPRLGQRPLAQRGKFFIKLAGKDKLQHCVAEEFQALVVLHGGALLMRDRRMRQCEAQQAFITERVTEAGLKGVQIRHNRNVEL